MKKVLSLLIIFTLSIKIYSQFQPVECTTEDDKNNSYVIQAKNKTLGTYTVKLMFSAFAGLEQTPGKDALHIVRPGTNQLLKLKPLSSGRPDFQYSYSYFEGKNFTKAPTNSIVYLLPSTAGNTIKHQSSQHIAERFGQVPPPDYKAYFFEMKLGDTIVASREGVITKINDDIQQGESMNTFYQSNRNLIRIEHPDGTMLSYTFTCPLTIILPVGKSVKTGQPIAVLHKESEKYGLFQSLFYLDNDKVISSQKPSKKYIYSYLPLIYHLQDATELEVAKEYVISHPLEILQSSKVKKDKK